MSNAEKHWIHPFINGAVASVVAETATFPFDLAKTRLQIQGQIIDAKYTKLKYRGPIHAVRKIFANEGFLALYSGIGPAVLRQFFYGGIKRGMYETLQGFCNKSPTLLLNFALACISGSASAVLCNPVDILKVRMQTQGTSLYSTARQLFTRDGVQGLFRGVVPNLCRTGILVGTTFSVYDETKHFVVHDLHIPDGIICYTISSSTASVIGTFAANPFDVIKSRMMNQSRNSIRYKNVLHCIIQTWKSEKISAFYKGCLTLLCRTVPWHFVAFSVEEKTLIYRRFQARKG